MKKSWYTPVVNLIRNFIGTMDHTQQGFAQKKVVAWAFVAMIIFIHICEWRYEWRLGNFSNMAYTLGADLSFLAACLGLNYLHEKNITNAPDGSTTSTDITTDQKQNGGIPQ